MAIQTILYQETPTQNRFQSWKTKSVS